MALIELKGIERVFQLGDATVHALAGLDLRIDKRWQFKTWQLSAYLDVQNVYNNGNVEGLQYNFNYTSRNYVTGIPILPSLGLRGEL